jgi:uncharacterized membrane protein
VDLALAVAVILAAAVRQEVGSQLVLITMLQKFKRILTHLWLDESDTRRAIPADMLARLTALVVANELRHSGELCIFVEAGLPASYLWRGAPPRERAMTLFGKLRVWDTEHNNGVLIYLLVPEHAIEIVADRGLARSVAPGEWEALVSQLAVHLREGRYEEGLAQAVDAVSAKQAVHFPRRGAGTAYANELPDAPVVR